ncbi:uncharacterized protein LOC116303979 [Actinia tenebrosa]|uniref:Uncharacterized protein LOC116303979 n=1 Tax=Actinia tenebrosa TaxID=6105 RepID=A0A6P8IRI7_ACTTE|nr:uncharacterized protein LOC116303979 [Actinia tenebrosa]
MVKIRVETRIIHIMNVVVVFDDVKDEKSERGKKFRKNFKNWCLQRLRRRKRRGRSRAWGLRIHRLRKGSVIVEYDLFVNATSQQETQDFIDGLQQEIDSGTIGNYTVDPNHPLGAKITMQGM